MISPTTLAYFQEKKINPELILQTFIQRQKKTFPTIISELFPTGNIEIFFHQNQEYFLLRRNQTTYSLLFKIHEGEENVKEKDCLAFIETCQQYPNTHGILISQLSGCEMHDNYSFVANEHTLSLFLHEGQYDGKKIKGMIDFLDALVMKYDFLGKEESELFTKMEAEYKKFYLQKDICIQQCKEFQNKCIYSMEALKIPTMEKEIGTQFLLAKPHNCLYCTFSGPNARSLSCHKRGHCGDLYRKHLPKPIKRTLSMVEEEESQQEEEEQIKT